MKRRPGVEQSVGLAKTPADFLRNNGSRTGDVTHAQGAPKSVNYPFVLKLLAKTYDELADWTALQALLPELQKHNVLNASEHETLSATLF